MGVRILLRCLLQGVSTRLSEVYFGVFLSWQFVSALRDVAEFLAAQTMAVSVESVGFSTTFPR